LNINKNPDLIAEIKDNLERNQRPREELFRFINISHQRYWFE